MTVTTLTGFLRQAHYTPVGGTTPTIEALKKVGGDGVFYLPPMAIFPGASNRLITFSTAYGPLLRLTFRTMLPIRAISSVPIRRR